MYKLFDQRETLNNGLFKPPEFEFLKRSYQSEIDKIVNYYQSRIFYAKSNHILCRILNTGMFGEQLSDGDFLTHCMVKSPYLAKFFQLTSSINPGKIFEGDFYGEGSSEILFYVESFIDPFESKANWKKLQPVKVLYHEISDTGFKIPDGNNNSIEKGFVTISVDVSMLLFQYRCFLRRELIKIEEGNPDKELQEKLGLSAIHFVKTYVLPNMLYSHAELVILNRLKNIFYGNPMGYALTKYPFILHDYDDKLDLVLEKILNFVTNKRLAYATVLQDFPVFFHEDMQEALLMPEIVRTTQVWWALMLSRIEVFKFLIDVGGTNGISMNKTYINKCKIAIRQLSNNPQLTKYLSEDIRYKFKNTSDFILSI